MFQKVVLQNFIIEPTDKYFSNYFKDLKYIIDQTAVQISLVQCSSSPLVVYFTRKNNEQSDNKLAVLFMEHKVIFTGYYGTSQTWNEIHNVGFVLWGYDFSKDTNYVSNKTNTQEFFTDC